MSREHEPGAKTAGSVFVTSAILLCLLLAIGFLAGSQVPFQRFRPWLSEAVRSEGGEALATSLFSAIPRRMRLLSFFLAGMATLLFLARKRLAGLADDFLREWRESARDLVRRAKQAARSAGRKPLWTAVILTLAAGAIRLAFLDRPLLWDEATTFLRFASHPPWYIVAWYPKPNNHVLYSLLASVSGWVFGNDVWTLRLPALLAGIATVPLGYAIARRQYGETAALLTGCLLAASAPLIAFSVNARGYSLVTLFFLILILLAQQLKERDNLVLWVMFSVVSALGFYTVPVMLYPVVVVVAWIVISAAAGDAAVAIPKLMRRLAMVSVLTGGLLAVFYAPLLLVSGPEALLTNRFVTPLPWSDFVVRAPVKLLDSWDAWRLNMPAAVAIPLGMGFVAALVMRRKLGQTTPIVLGALILPVVIAAQRVAPEPRVLVFVFPLFVLTASAGLAFFCDRLELRLLGRSRAILGFLLVLALSCGWVYRTAHAVYLFDPEAEREILPHEREVVGFLQGELKPGDRVVLAFPSHNAIRYYFRIRKLDAFLEATENAQRLFVVVNGMRPNFGVQEILRAAHCPVEQYTAPVALLDLESVQVYELSLR